MKKKLEFVLLFALYLGMTVWDHIKKPGQQQLYHAAGGVILVLMGLLLSNPFTSVPTLVGVFILLGLLFRMTLPLPQHTEEQWDKTSDTMILMTVTGITAYEVGGLWLSLLSILVVLPLINVLPAAIGGKDYDTGLVAKASMFSRYAYGDVKKLKSKYVYNQETGTLGGVSVDKDMIVIFFSGSTSLQDFSRTNIDVASIPLPGNGPCDIDVSGARVHRGFWSAYESVRNQLMVLLTDVAMTQVNIKHVLITGHSLGGALASLCVVDVCALFENISVVTFGAPQVGNATWTALVKNLVPPQKMIRVTTMFDPVPRSLGTIFSHPEGIHVLFDSPPNPYTAHDPGTYMQMAHPTSSYWLYITVTLIVMILIATVHHEPE